MKVLVIGGGGREHALVWKIAQSPGVTEIIAAPGNAGISRIARTVPIGADDIEGLAGLAEDEACDLTVVGPELPLTLGITDVLVERGLLVFGPSRAAAAIEGSKWFAKDLMLRAGIPTAAAEAATDRDRAVGLVRDMGCPVVIKADGLAAGKGVVVARDEGEALEAIDDAMMRGRYGAAGRTVLIEECLEGEEASILAFTDGRSIGLLVSSQDHKRAFDGDAGPNTGGMGAYAPAPIVTPGMRAIVEERVVAPVIEALSRFHGVTYRGVLYAGLMITDDGPKVIEFNCRFGDPEAQVTLPLLDADIVDVMESVARGDLDAATVRAKPGAAACVVIASGGYPGKYEKGKEIHGLDDVDAMEGVTVFHAGTADENGRVVTSGGRVLGVTAVADDLPSAVARAYEGAAAVSFDGAHNRTDIGHRALARLRT
jgi:phosphoribosylamine--glycine ligase